MRQLHSAIFVTLFWIGSKTGCFTLFQIRYLLRLVCLYLIKLLVNCFPWVVLLLASLNLSEMLILCLFDLASSFYFVDIKTIKSREENNHIHMLKLNQYLRWNKIMLVPLDGITLSLPLPLIEETCTNILKKITFVFHVTNIVTHIFSYCYQLEFTFYWIIQLDRQQ